jgi:hypothetical protein
LQNLKKSNGDWTPTHKTPLLPKTKTTKECNTKETSHKIKAHKN